MDYQRLWIDLGLAVLATGCFATVECLKLWYHDHEQQKRRKR